MKFQYTTNRNHIYMLICQVQIHQTTIGWCQKLICSSKGLTKSSKDVPNVFDIADDILIIECDTDGRDHDRTLKQVMQRYHQENIKK